MSPYLVGILASIFAEQARIEAMKAENTHRQACGKGIAYGEDSFGAIAAELDRLSIAAKNAP